MISIDSEKLPERKPHRTLEERLSAFYGKPIEQIERDETDEEVDWGSPVGEEYW